MNAIVTREAFGAITTMRFDERAGIPLRGGGGLCEFAGEGHVSGSGDMHSNGRGGEGEHTYVFTNGQGTDLVNGATPPVENTLRDLPLAARAEATLLMTNRNGDYDIEITRVILHDPARFELLNPAERCIVTTELRMARANLCRFQIRRRNETTVGQNSRIEIRYRYPRELFFGIRDYRQEFNLIAT